MTGLDVSGALPWYHWNVRFGPPLAMALKSVEDPWLIVRLDGVAVTCGARQLTVTVAALLSAAGVHAPVTRTQYVVVDCGFTLMVAVVPLKTGELVFPFAPAYH